MKNKKIFILSLIFFLLDFVIKLIIKSNMELYEKITIIKNFFSIEYVMNSGAAFSLFNNFQIILVIISIVILIYLIKYLLKNDIKNKLQKLAFSFVIGGIVGNMFDRIVYKKVIDYLSFKIFNYEFAIFNLADVGIVLGTIVLAISYIGVDINEGKSRRRNRKN